MPKHEDQAPPSRYELAKDDVLALLEYDVSYPGWEHETAEKKAYYVRGFTWFRDEVLLNGGFQHITNLKSYVPAMKTLLDTRKTWKAVPLTWDDKFSDRKLVDAASPHAADGTPKFHKAAEIILLCEVVADARHKSDPTAPTGADVYDHMRIEPAVSYVHGLTRLVIEALKAEQFNTLRLWTGQRSNDVFFSMADGKTVTGKLAHRTRNFFHRKLPDVALGDIDHRFNPRRIYNPAEDEVVDVKEKDLPAETGYSNAGQP